MVKSTQFYVELKLVENELIHHEFYDWRGYVCGWGTYILIYGLKKIINNYVDMLYRNDVTNI